MSGAPAAPIGVVTGSRSEAHCVPQDVHLVVRCSGADADRARTRAKALAQEGVGGLVSFGLAGGLDPLLRPGDLLLPEIVLVPARHLARFEGDDRREAGFRVSPAWRQEMAGRLDRAALAYRGGPLVGSGTAITGPAAKRTLHMSTGGLAVDMESHAVAEVAAGHGLPFLVLRAVADPAGVPLPPVALMALRPDGRSDAAGLLRGLIARPADLWPLVRLVAYALRGLRTLREASRML